MNYILYRTVAAGDEPVGYVVNVIVYDGTSPLPLPSGVAVAADAARQYPIGSVYTAPPS
ncbi:hypothetical protein JUN65_02135 [Gluconacetobacter azotocaptans]|uniref:hypothetical protein n=1 Tax=Gluconacetobacter azotocaptans TaxID=142834 RepID=UPI0019574055|nr:hypothetical protein [Gluconacetobacter azotocaptans]MBM9400393.1 hypothetical protein [Gluconacetobacter azotocaptans]